MQQPVEDYKSCEKFEFSLTLGGDDLERESQWVRIDALDLKFKLVKLSDKAPVSSSVHAVAEIQVINQANAPDEYCFQIEIARKGRNSVSSKSSPKSFSSAMSLGETVKVTFSPDNTCRTFFESSPVVLKVQLWKSPRPTDARYSQRRVCVRSELSMSSQIQQLWFQRDEADCRIHVIERSDRENNTLLPPNSSEGNGVNTHEAANANNVNGFDLVAPEEDGLLALHPHSLPVHGFLLKLRSTVFKHILESNMLETSTRVIVIDDVSLAAVEAMVEFLYRDAVSFESLKADPFGVFVLAHRYELLGLVEMSFEVLSQSLASNTAIKTLQLAHFYELHGLKASALELVRRDAKRAIEDGGFLSSAQDNTPSFSEILLTQLGAKLMDEVLFSTSY